MIRFGSFLIPLLLAGVPAADLAAAPDARSGPAGGSTRLVLLGGGDHPAEAMARFVAWAGGETARVLVVPWASGEPRQSCEALVAELRSLRVASAGCAPDTVLDAKGRAAPLEPAGRRAFTDALARSTGVFFAGGDQGRVMDVLADEALLAALRQRYAAGVVFGGTSAGTAIMSPIMITGEGDFTLIDGTKVGTRPGLGLLEGVIVDQHFVKRQRENRLFGLVLMHPELRGVGIDEDTALLVTKGRQAEVVGRGLVVVVDGAGPDRLELTLLRPGRSIDLSRPDREKTARRACNRRKSPDTR